MSSYSASFECQDEAATERLAQAIADALPARLTVGLIGTLGAGKTHLVRAIVAAAGGQPEDVVSPTFVLCQHYDAPGRRFHHLDAYRIQDDDEFLEIGVEELFDSEAVTLVEWSDRVRGCLPPERLEIALEVTGRSSRKATLAAGGPMAEAVIRDVESALM